MSKKLPTTTPGDKVFYLSPTQKVHREDCRHCRNDNEGWIPLESLAFAIQNGYQTCRQCCPPLSEVETKKESTILRVKSKSNSKSTSEQKSSSISISELQTTSLVDLAPEIKSEAILSPISTQEIDSQKEIASVSEAKSEIETKSESEANSAQIETKLESETNSAQIETKLESEANSAQIETKSESEANSAQIETKLESEANSTEIETKLESETNSTEIETKLESETNSTEIETKLESETNSTEIETKLESEANSAQIETKLESETKQDKNQKKETSKKKQQKDEEKAEKKRYKILAGNGCHQAIAEVQGMLLRPSQEDEKFQLILPDGFKIDASFKNPRLAWIAYNQDSTIGLHWFRGYPKMSEGKLVCFQIISWDGQMPTSQQGEERWEFIGLWTPQNNLTVQRSMGVKEIRTIAKETGFIKKFKFSFTNSRDWVGSKKLWIGYVYKLLCRREGDTLKIQKVIPYACPRNKPVPRDKGDFNRKGNYQEKRDFQVKEKKE